MGRLELGFKGELNILQALARKGGCLNLTRLQRESGLNHSSATRHLTHLEGDRLVTITRYPSRVVMIRLNEEDPRVQLIMELFGGS